MKRKSATGKKSIVRLLALFLTVCIIALSVSSCTPVEREVHEKDVILENIESSENKNYIDTYTYFERWGFPMFDKNEFSAVEMKYHLYYVEKLGSNYEIAKQTATIFMNDYYDTLNTADEDAVTVALINAFIDYVGDKYSVYRTADQFEEYEGDMSGEYCGIGVTVEYDPDNNTLLIISVQPDSPAKAAGFREGDYIYSVGGKTIDEVGYDGIVALIRGVAGTEVTVNIIRNGVEMALTATRAQLTEYTVQLEMRDGDVAYIRITQFKDNTDEQFGKAIEDAVAQGAKGIIFDLRSNPGGYLDAILNALEYLVPKGVQLASYEYGGRVYNFKSERDDKLDIPCVVLCNEYTASAGELFTAAIRDFGNMGLIDEYIIGKTTFGKGIMQSTYMLQSGSTITMTVAYYNPPSGVNYHEVGVVPDSTVELTETGDVQYDAAYVHLLSMIGN